MVPVDNQLWMEIGGSGLEHLVFRISCLASWLLEKCHFADSWRVLVLGLVLAFWPCADTCCWVVLLLRAFCSWTGLTETWGILCLGLGSAFWPSADTWWPLLLWLASAFCPCPDTWWLVVWFWGAFLGCCDLGVDVDDWENGAGGDGCSCCLCPILKDCRNLLSARNSRTNKNVCWSTKPMGGMIVLQVVHA